MTQEENEFSKHLIQNKKKLHEAQLVSEFLESDVYKEVISKKLDEMISGIGGYKEGDFWKAGSGALRSISGDMLRYVSGYQAGLIEFSMFLKRVIQDGQKAKEEMNKKEEYVNPMEAEYA